MFARRCLPQAVKPFQQLGRARARIVETDILSQALADTFFERKWIRRVGDSRALKITVEGRRQLRHLGLYTESPD